MLLHAFVVLGKTDFPILVLRRGNSHKAKNKFVLLLDRQTVLVTNFNRIHRKKGTYCNTQGMLQKVSTPQDP